MVQVSLLIFLDRQGKTLVINVVVMVILIQATLVSEQLLWKYQLLVANSPEKPKPIAYMDVLRVTGITGVLITHVFIITCTN
jgi:hypothetical protein